MILFENEKLSPTKKLEQRLVTRAMERSNLRTALCEQIESLVTREQNGVKDVIVQYRKPKLCWTRHVARFANNWLICAVVEWHKRDRKWHIGIPQWRLQKEIVKWFEQTWRRMIRSWTLCKCVAASGIKKDQTDWPITFCLVWFGLIADQHS